MTRYLTVTWDMLHRDSRRLAALLLARGPVRGLVAVSRGGLIPAAIVAREIECRLVECIAVASYDEERRGEPAVLKHPAAAGEGAGWVIIDDLVDSGVTARLVRRMLPGALFACLYAKPAGAPVADLFVSEVAQDEWILFPWDTGLAPVPPIARAS